MNTQKKAYVCAAVHNFVRLLLNVYQVEYPQYSLPRFTSTSTSTCIQPNSAVVHPIQNKDGISIKYILLEEEDRIYMKFKKTHPSSSPAEPAILTKLTYWNRAMLHMGYD
jgi:hypothetical protein